MYMDRMRGSAVRMIPEFTIGKYTIKGGDVRLMYGWVVATIYGHELDLLTIPIMVLFAAGESWGWTEAIRAPLDGRNQQAESLDKWQLGPLGDPGKGWMALCFRGLMWGAPVALLSYFDPNLMSLPFVFMLSMPLGVLIAKHLPGDRDDRWENQEKFRGLMTGILATAVMI